MAPELGVFALILAFCLSLSQAFFGLVGAWRGKPVWMSVARPAVTGQFVFVAVAFICLVYCFVNYDFSVLYVAKNSNSHLPLFTELPHCGERTKARCCCGSRSSPSGASPSPPSAAVCP